jgi:hypothetical protein
MSEKDKKQDIVPAMLFAGFLMVIILTLVLISMPGF